MAKVIEGLYYSESHEFVRVEGDYGFVGITDYAQNALGNVVYVDMPEVDDEVTAGEEFGAVESVKAASDLISPVSGTVVEVNEALDDQPELINEDAFENWIIKVQLSDKADLDNLTTSWMPPLTPLSAAESPKLGDYRGLNKRRLQLITIRKV